MSNVGRPRGSKNPQRIRSQELQWCLELVKCLSPDEAFVVRAAACERVAESNGFCDRPEEPRDRIILAFSEADLRKREATGQPLRTVDDYKTHKPAWGPSMSSVYREFRSFEEARSEAGLRNVLQPETALGIVDGRPKGGGRRWDDTDFLHALALCYEKHRGRRFSWDSYKEYRRSTTRDLPGNDKFAKKETGRSWDEWLDAAADYIVECGPQRFPVAHDFITRDRAARKAA